MEFKLMMRKLIILSILLISCINLHKIPNISLTNKYVTYNKVKIKINLKTKIYEKFIFNTNIYYYNYGL